MLLVGIVVSQTSHQDTVDAAHSAAIDAQNNAPAALAVLPGQPLITVDALKYSGQKQPFQFKRGGKLVLTEGQGLQVTGWAVDEISKSAPSAVFIQVDEFARSQGSLSDRPDVAAAFKNPNYTRSGFGINLPAAMLPKGVHRLAFLVESKNREGYYVDPVWFNVVVAPRSLAASNARALSTSTAYAVDRVSAGARQ